jgi:2-polyprenyl-3-methyl-5-hydroxy-6-metoxy-1,4-benzoquinol methylase
MLELGAGAASNALWLARRGFEAVAVDFSPRAVAIAKARAVREGLALDARIVDVTRGDDTLGRFDVVVDRECLQDLKRAEDRAAYARHVLRWMNPRAALVIASWVFRDERAARRPFPTSRLPLGEVPRLLPELEVEHVQVETRRLYGFSSEHATFLLRRSA